MSFRLKKLNTAGVAHHALIAVAVVLAFASFGAYRVFYSKAATSSGPQLTQDGKKTNGCVPGKHVVNGNCQKYSEVSTIKADCSTYNLQYDNTTGGCKTSCIAGWHKDSTNNCIENATPAPSTDCSSGQVKIDGQCVNKLTCNAPNTEYKASTNQCVCVAGYSRVNTDCVRDKTPTTICPRGQVLVNDQCQTPTICTAPNTVLQTSTNTCVCKTGYTQNSTSKVCEPNKSTNGTPGPTDQCSTGTARCITPAQVKASCNAQFLQYDSTANKCKEGCKADYVKKNGKCVDRATAQNTMTEHLCKVLGRDWIVPRVGEGPVNGPKAPYCSKLCLDTENSTFVKAASDTKSYCKATAVGSLGASADISKTDCEAANRNYVDNAGVCSARCSVGYHLNAEHTECLPLDSVTGTNGDGEGEEGGCLGGASPNNDGTCPEDATEEPTNDAPTLKLDTNMDKKTCELLGREWESGTKDKDGKKIKGCNVEKCEKKSDKIVKNDNGKPFCKGHVAKIDKEKCQELHRVWVPEAKACAVAPNQNKKDGKRVLKSDQCKPPYTTYVYKSDQGDECLKPSTVEKLKKIAKSTGTPFVALTNMSKAGVCNVQPHKHWNGSKCVKDKPAQHNTGQGGSSTNSGPSGIANGSGGSGGSGGGSGTSTTCSPDVQHCNSGTGGAGSGSTTCNPGEGHGCASGSGGSTPADSSIKQSCEHDYGYWTVHVILCRNLGWTYQD